MRERIYYEINEQSARSAHEMMSFRDYKEGSLTAEYKGYVDEAYDLADKVAESRPEEVDRVYGIADRYSKKMAANLNDRSRMRLQLFFEEKPESDVRDILKKNGFRWSPKNNCWQRQLTDNARYSLEKVKKELETLK